MPQHLHPLPAEAEARGAKPECGPEFPFEPESPLTMNRVAKSATSFRLGLPSVYIRSSIRPLAMPDREGLWSTTRYDSTSDSYGVIPELSQERAATEPGHGFPDGLVAMALAIQQLSSFVHHI